MVLVVLLVLVVVLVVLETILAVLGVVLVVPKKDLDDEPGHLLTRKSLEMGVLGAPIEGRTRSA